MGSIYKSTSHFYFCYVIKKRIKKHHLTHSEELHYDIDLGGVITVGGVLMNENQFPNHWQVNLGGRETLHLDDNGDMIITGRIHAIGTVIWNQELQRLEFWDGNIWQHLVTSNIV